MLTEITKLKLLGIFNLFKAIIIEDGWVVTTIVVAINMAEIIRND